MAFKRQRGDSWEFVVKRAGLLDKPLTLTFAAEAEGDVYCKRLEMLLDQGIVPQDHKPKGRVLTIEQLIDQYESDHSVKQMDREMLRALAKVIGDVSVAKIDANWVDEWIATMKHENHYTPSTISAKVGALARCCDWGMRKKLILMPDHPLRTLPNGYAQYNPRDAAIVGGKIENEERDRRLEGDEEANIRAVLDAGALPRKQRPYTLEHKSRLIALFTLSLETAMRLRELYTLTGDQIDLKGSTVHLEKTKNGDRRTVPMTSIALAVFETLPKKGALFPWLAEQKGNLKLTSNFLSKLFSEVFAAAGCADLHYHDLRHEAVSRLFERTTLSVEELMKITGHKTHRMMMRYLKLRSSNLAAKLW